MDKKEKEPSQSKSYTEKFSFKLLIVTAITFLIICAYLIAVQFADNESKRPIVRLPDEKLAGEGYTSRTKFDDSDMWEEDAVPALAETVLTEVSYSESDSTELATSAIEFPIDINLASFDELIMIDGIGEVIAQRIIDYRSRYGYFFDYEELLNVEGIGEKKLSNLRKYIFISDDLLVISEETTVVTEVSSDEFIETEVVTPETTEDFVIETEEFIIEYEDFESEEVDYDETQEINVNFPLELNSASVDELMCIDGIGESTAFKIVEYARVYKFYSVDELVNVDGIGISKLEVIAPYVYVDTYMLPPRETVPEETTTVFTEPVIMRVNLNTCGIEELIQLPGIDRQQAEKILTVRTEIGGFMKIEELSLVDGMSNSKLSAIWDYIYV